MDGLLLSRAAINLLRATISDDRVGCPKQRMGVSVYRFSGVDETRTIDQAYHGLTQRLRPRKSRVCGLSPKGVGSERGRRVRHHGPVGHQQRAGAGVEEGPPKAGDAFGAGLCPRSSVACGEDDPIGIELEGLRAFSIAAATALTPATSRSLDGNASALFITPSCTLICLARS